MESYKEQNERDTVYRVEIPKDRLRLEGTGEMSIGMKWGLILTAIHNQIAYKRLGGKTKEEAENELNKNEFDMSEIPEFVNERNGLLIDFITELNLGIHVVSLPQKPALLSADYTRRLFAYVKNFHLILTKGNDEVYLDIRLKPLRNMNMEELKPQILEWLVAYEHERIYTLTHKESGLFLVGFNHHNKILKTNPYPVFAVYDPLTYYDEERAVSIQERFVTYNLIIK